MNYNGAEKYRISFKNKKKLRSCSASMASEKQRFILPADYN